MSIKLEVITFRGKKPHSQLSVSAGQEKITIGRKDDNSWVLDDTNKFISNHHAIVEYEIPDYFMTDISSNGIFINGTKSTLGRNGKYQLHDDDNIKIGEYEIAISINDEIETSADSHPDNPSQAKSRLSEASHIDIQEFSLPDFLIDDFSISEVAASEEEQNFSSAQADINLNADVDFTSTDYTPVSPQTDAAIVEEFPPLQDIKEASGSNKPEPEDLCDATDKPSETREAETTEPAVALESTVDASEIRKTGADGDEQTLDAIDQFIKGAGLQNNQIINHLDASSFFIIGKMLRVMLKGTMDVLQARDDFKSELRLDVTRIRSTENNPIKFSVSVEEALFRLMIPQRDGYMSPDQSIVEAFDDLKVHQVAVLAGMQTAIQTVLKRLDPKILAQKLQHISSISASIPFHRQAKLWELFEQLYEEIEQQTQDDFNQIFGQAFAEAYSTQIKNLKT